MAAVDPSDDAISRWVIRHYRYDRSRRERRNVEVAAYDNESDFEAEFARYAARVSAEIADGTRSYREWVSGVALEPGYLATQALGHNVRRAIEHGVDPAPLFATGALPGDMVVFTSREDVGSAASPER